MRIKVDIEARLGSGEREFHLQAALSTDADCLVLFGPSGSGKTLTLQALAGLLRPDGGRIEVGGTLLFDGGAGIDVPARDRRMGYVFQNYALMPHLTVAANVAFGVARLGWSGRGLASEEQARVNRLLERFELDRVADLKPHAISGGQKQRAALARALAREPSLLLLDEPFSALDQPLRQRMREELAAVREEFGVPLMLVTHDVEDVAFFARSGGQSIAVFDQGRVARLCGSEEISDGDDWSELFREI